MGHTGGATRRTFLGLGGVAPLALGLPQLLAAEARSGTRSARPRSCIFLFLYGGPSQLDTWDLKPLAPAEFRGEFRPIPTSVPGTRVCEHLPRMARLAQHYTILRALRHSNRNHNPAGAWVLTGSDPQTDNTSQLAPRGDDPPALGSLAARLAPSRQGLPSFIMMPARLFDQSTVLRGQAGGWLGNRYDPLIIAQDPNRADFRLDGFGRDSDVSSLRLDARQSLLAALDPPSTAAPACVMSEFRQRAFDLLTTAKGQAAFDLTEEPSAVRERYGRNPFGQGCLLARRLVEAGVRLVTVSDCTPTGHHAWDTHSKNFETLKDTLLPRLDQAYSALLEDLLARGLLGETVVYLGGEFGRTPRIGLSTAAGATPDGRDHWPDCFSGVLAGGLTRAGMVYGASDARAAHPSENAMTPQDLAATLFAAMGLDPETMVKTRDNRPMPISPGTVHRGLLA